MKKTVIYEFSDDFKFPEYFGQKNIEKEFETKLIYNKNRIEKRKVSACDDCPIAAYVDDESYCGITGDSEYTKLEERHECPFYRGQETVIYEQ